MADIGKDGKNLFQSIFHNAHEKHHASSTADCSNINNSEQNVNKQKSDSSRLDNVSSDPLNKEENLQTVTKTEKASPEEPLSMDYKPHSAANSYASVGNDHLDATNGSEHIVENGVSPSHVDESVEGSVNGPALKSEEAVGSKRKKGIHFPADTCISGYHEPPDPWKDATTCTPEEMVAAYKRSCEIHATKPSVKVLQQLQILKPVPGKREEVLSLKGEKLDLRQCETIEEVLRRVQFKLLDFEACHLDDESAQALFDMIEYYESACQLNISFNKSIGVRGWQACSRLVRRTPSLTYLDMRSCEMDERTIPLFGRALKLGCHLTILHMENMSLAGKTLIILVAALKMNETLQELFLAENKLMPSDGVHLGHLMRYNHRLGLLDLRNNHLQDVGTSHICEGLLEQGGGLGLRTLVLWNNQINYQAMPALGKALAISETLETLNIGHNAITNEGAHLLKDGLLKTNSLLRLGLQGTRISDEGAVALAEYIADSTILLRVDLRDNDIKTGGLMALSHAMRVNTSVTRIDLDKDPKKESSMKDYAEQQGRLLRDILTFQQRNVEAALQREEEERAELERRAQIIQDVQDVQGEEEAEDVDGEKAANQEQEEVVTGNVTDIQGEEKEEPKDNGNAESASAVPQGAEAFTIIDRNEAAEQVSYDECSEEPASEQERSSEDSATGSQSTNLRPSHLFKQTPLRAQESLDSPLPSAGREEESQLIPDSDDVGAKQKRLKAHLDPLPPEVILSPQYVSRTMARKIFSVSRVSEEPRQSDSSHISPMSGWDPLNASTIPVSLSACPSSSINSSISRLANTTLPNTQDASGQSSEPSEIPTVQTQTLNQSAVSVCDEHVSTSGEDGIVKQQPSACETSCEIQHAPEDSQKLSSSADEACPSSNTSVTDPQTQVLPFPSDDGNTNSSSGTGSPHLSLQHPAKNFSPSPSIQISAEEQSMSCTLHQDNVLSPDASLLDTGNNSKQQGDKADGAILESACEPGILPLSQSMEPASLQGSGDSAPLAMGNKSHRLSESLSLSHGDAKAPDIRSSSQADPIINVSEKLANANLPPNSHTSAADSLVDVKPNSPTVFDCLPPSEAGDPPVSENSHTTMQLGGVTSDTFIGEVGDDGEAWLAVEGEEAEGKPSDFTTASQPDFFTTLTLNGLTQELASALTSLDGSPGSPGSPNMPTSTAIEECQEHIA